jgi:hypothetical protein
MRDVVLSVGRCGQGQCLPSAIETMSEIAGRLTGPGREWALTITAMFAYAAGQWADVAIITATARAESTDGSGNRLLEDLDHSRLTGPFSEMMLRYLGTGVRAAVALGIDPDIF